MCAVFRNVVFVDESMCVVFRKVVLVDDYASGMCAGFD